MHRRLLSLVVLLVSIVAAAQVRLSIDERCVQIAGGKKMTTERSLYLGTDGTIVCEQQRPAHSISQTNALGEMRIYNPADNTLVAVNDKEMASDKNIVAMFASGSYVDMALPLYGYTQSEVRSEEGLLIKTFVPKGSEGAIAKVELVFQNHLPICMVYYNGKGQSVRKMYFSRYEYGRIPMPMRITEVEYSSPTDSLVTLSTYSNLRFGEDATSEMFDWQPPADAKRTDIDPKQLLAK